MVRVVKISQHVVLRSRIGKLLLKVIGYIVLCSGRKYREVNSMSGTALRRGGGYLAKQMYKVITAFSCDHREIGEALIIINSSEPAFPVPILEPSAST